MAKSSHLPVWTGQRAPLAVMSPSPRLAARRQTRHCRRKTRRKDPALRARLVSLLAKGPKFPRLALSNTPSVHSGAGRTQLQYSGRPKGIQLAASGSQALQPVTCACHPWAVATELLLAKGSPWLGSIGFLCLTQPLPGAWCLIVLEELSKPSSLAPWELGSSK